MPCVSQTKNDEWIQVVVDLFRACFSSQEKLAAAFTARQLLTYDGKDILDANIELLNDLNAVLNTVELVYLDAEHDRHSVETLVAHGETTTGYGLQKPSRYKGFLERASFTREETECMRLSDCLRYEAALSASMSNAGEAEFYQTYIIFAGMLNDIVDSRVASYRKEHEGEIEGEGLKETIKIKLLEELRNNEASLFKQLNLKDDIVMSKIKSWSFLDDTFFDYLNGIDLSTAAESIKEGLSSFNKQLDAALKLEVQRQQVIDLKAALEKTLDDPLIPDDMKVVGRNLMKDNTEVAPYLLSTDELVPLIISLQEANTSIKAAYAKQVKDRVILENASDENKSAFILQMDHYPPSSLFGFEHRINQLNNLDDTMKQDQSSFDLAYSALITYINKKKELPLDDPLLISAEKLVNMIGTDSKQFVYRAPVTAQLQLVLEALEDPSLDKAKPFIKKTEDPEALLEMASSSDEADNSEQIIHDFGEQVIIRAENYLSISAVVDLLKKISRSPYKDSDLYTSANEVAGAIKSSLLDKTSGKSRKSFDKIIKSIEQALESPSTAMANVFLGAENNHEKCKNLGDPNPKLDEFYKKLHIFSVHVRAAASLEPAKAALIATLAEANINPKLRVLAEKLLRDAEVLDKDAEQPEFIAILYAVNSALRTPALGTGHPCITAGAALMAADKTRSIGLIVLGIGAVVCVLALLALTLFSYGILAPLTVPSMAACIGIAGASAAALGGGAVLERKGSGASITAFNKFKEAFNKISKPELPTEEDLTICTLNTPSCS